MLHDMLSDSVTTECTMTHIHWSDAGDGQHHACCGSPLLPPARKDTLNVLREYMPFGAKIWCSAEGIPAGDIMHTDGTLQAP